MNLRRLPKCITRLLIGVNRIRLRAKLKMDSSPKPIGVDQMARDAALSDFHKYAYQWY